MTSKKAFTLTEMLITFLIITTLFVLVVAYVDFSGEEKRQTAASVELMEIQKAAIQVAAEHEGFSDSLSTLASQFNIALKNDMVFVANGAQSRLESEGLDPWGMKYRITAERPLQTNGQIKIACAGADKTFQTSDDLISYVRYGTVTATGSIAVSTDGSSFEEVGAGVLRDDWILEDHPTWGETERYRMSELSWDDFLTVLADPSPGKDSLYLGDSKRLDFGTDIDGDGEDDYIVLTIVGFGCDPLWAPVGEGEVTLLVTESSIQFQGTRTTSTGGWREQEILDYLNDTLINYFPSNIRNQILPVQKTADSGNPYYNAQTTTSRLWLPSVEELTGESLRYSIGGETVYANSDGSNMFELYKRGHVQYFKNEDGICHAPTRTSIKGTQYFAAICSAGDDKGHSAYLQSDEMTLFFGITLGVVSGYTP